MYTAFDLSLRPLANDLINRDKSERSLSMILDSFYRFYAEENNFTCVHLGR